MVFPWRGHVGRRLKVRLGRPYKTPTFCDLNEHSLNLIGSSICIHPSIHPSGSQLSFKLVATPHLQTSLLSHSLGLGTILDTNY